MHQILLLEYSFQIDKHSCFSLLGPGILYLIQSIESIQSTFLSAFSPLDLPARKTPGDNGENALIYNKERKGLFFWGKRKVFPSRFPQFPTLSPSGKKFSPVCLRVIPIYLGITSLMKFQTIRV